MNKISKYVLGATALVAVSAGVAGVTTYNMMEPRQQAAQTFDDIFKQDTNARLAGFNAINQQPVDLTGAAAQAVHAVVHIKATE